MGLRRSRYIGQERTHLQHVATAAAINVVRLIRWLGGVPHAKTRQSPFAQLHRPAASQASQGFATSITLGDLNSPPSHCAILLQEIMKTISKGECSGQTHVF